MNFRRIPKRSTVSIVQQTNCLSSKQMFKDFFAGKPLNIPGGSDQRSYDFDDHTKIDWDSPRIDDCEDLIEQHFMRDEFMNHLHPTSPAAEPDSESSAVIQPSSASPESPSPEA